MRLRARRRREPPAAVLAHQIVDDGAGLGDGDVAVVDHRRLAEGVGGLEFGRREVGHRIAPIGLDLIGRTQFLQQPQDALRA